MASVLEEIERELGIKAPRPEAAPAPSGALARDSEGYRVAGGPELFSEREDRDIEFSESAVRDRNLKEVERELAKPDLKTKNPKAFQVLSAERERLLGTKQGPEDPLRGAILVGTPDKLVGYQHGEREADGFDPNGKEYDYESAKAAGLKPDATGHWPSRDPKSGKLLKGRKHETWALTEKGESDAGNEIYQGADGRYYSHPRGARRALSTSTRSEGEAPTNALADIQEFLKQAPSVEQFKAKTPGAIPVERQRLDVPAGEPSGEFDPMGRPVPQPAISARPDATESTGTARSVGEVFDRGVDWLVKNSPLRPEDKIEQQKRISAKQRERQLSGATEMPPTTRRLDPAEEQQRKTMQEARDKHSKDFVNNVVAYADTLGPELRKVMGGMMLALGEGLNAELNKTNSLDEELTGEVSDARRNAIFLTGLGRDFGESGDRDSKEAMKGMKPGWGAKAVGGAMQSITHMLPAIAVGVMTGGVGGVLSTMGVTTFGNAYGDGRREGLTPAQAAVYAGIYATIEVGTEYAPVKALMARHPGLGKWFWNFLVREVPSEILATTFQSALDKVSVTPEMTPADFGDALLTTILSTPLAAGAQAGVMAAARGGSKGYSEDQAAAIKEKFDAGIAQFNEAVAGEQQRVQAERDLDAKVIRGRRAAERKGRAAPEAEGAPSHRLDDGTAVSPVMQEGKPVAGFWKDAAGKVHEAPEAKPIQSTTPNATIELGGVEYDVTVTGKGNAKDTARLATGREVPIAQLDLADDAKTLLGIKTEAELKAEAKEKEQTKAAPAPKATPAAPAAEKPEASAPAAPEDDIFSNKGKTGAAAKPVPVPAEAPAAVPAAKPEGRPDSTKIKEATRARNEAAAPKLEATRNLQMQNRMREGAASVQQMNQIAENPDYERLSFSKAPETGAPMVSVAGGTTPSAVPSEQIGKQSVVVIGGTKVPVRYAVVEAPNLLASHYSDGRVRQEYFDDPKVGEIRALNNGRVAGLRDAYLRDTWHPYREALLADPDHGVDPKVIEGMKSPVLVRLYPESFNESIKNIGQASQGETLRQSPTEVALQDAAKITPEAMAAFQPGESGEVSAPSNDIFVAWFMKDVTPASEHGELIDPQTKKPNQRLYDRIQAAIFQKAFGSKELTGMFSEAADPEIRAVLNALAIAAPEMAKLEGSPVELDMRPFITEAAKLMLMAKRAKTKFSTYIKQQDIEGRNPVVQEIAEMMSANLRSPRRLGEALKTGAQFSQWAVAQAATGDIFGDAPKYDISNSITAVQKYMKEHYVGREAPEGGEDSASGKAAAKPIEYETGRETARDADAGGRERAAPRAERASKKAEKPVRQGRRAQVDDEREVDTDLEPDDADYSTMEDELRSAGYDMRTGKYPQADVIERVRDAIVEKGGRGVTVQGKGYTGAATDEQILDAIRDLENVDAARAARRKEKRDAAKETPAGTEALGVSPATAIRSVEAAIDLLIAGKLKPNPARNGQCYRFAGQKTITGAGDYLIVTLRQGDQKFPERRIWHALVIDNEGRLYDPNYDRWFAPRVLEVLNSVKPVYRMSAVDVARYGTATGQWPSPKGLNLRGSHLEHPLASETDSIRKTQPVLTRTGRSKVRAKDIEYDHDKALPARLHLLMDAARESGEYVEIRYRIEAGDDGIYELGSRVAVVIENIEAKEQRTGKTRALLKSIKDEGGVVIPEEIFEDAYPFWEKMANEGLAEGEFFLEPTAEEQAAQDAENAAYEAKRKKDDEAWAIRRREDTIKQAAEHAEKRAEAQREVEAGELSEYEEDYPWAPSIDSTAPLVRWKVPAEDWPHLMHWNSASRDLDELERDVAEAEARDRARAERPKSKKKKGAEQWESSRDRITGSELRKTLAWAQAGGAEKYPPHPLQLVPENDRGLTRTAPIDFDRLDGSKHGLLRRFTIDTPKGKVQIEIDASPYVYAQEEDPGWWLELTAKGASVGKWGHNAWRGAPASMGGREGFEYIAKDPLAAAKEIVAQWQEEAVKEIADEEKAAKKAAKELVNLKAKQEQGGLFGELPVPAKRNEPRTDVIEVTVFSSGMSRPADYTKALAQGNHVGVEVGELSEADLKKLPKALAESENALLFVDSGAYSIFKANQKALKGPQFTLEEFGSGGKALNFDQIFDRYEKLQLEASRADEDNGGEAASRILFVMPDIVGDQAGSIALAEKYAEQITLYGRQAIVPLQAGELTLLQAYEKIVEVVGNNFRIGIPSNALAAPTAQVEELLVEHGANIEGVHYLGAGSRSRLKDKLDAVRNSGFDGEVTSDANALRSKLTEDTPRADALREALKDKVTVEPIVEQLTIAQAADRIAAMDEETRDNTEIGNFPGHATAYNLFEARKLLPKSSNKLKKVTDNNTFNLSSSFDYIANVEGVHYGVTKQEDPDDDENEAAFIYSFERLDTPGHIENTITADKDELFDLMRADAQGVATAPVIPAPVIPAEGKAVETYWKGDKAVYTGKEQDMHGGHFYEIRMVEGHLAGEMKWTQRGPDGKEPKPAPADEQLATAQKKLAALELDANNAGDRRLREMFGVDKTTPSAIARSTKMLDQRDKLRGEEHDKRKGQMDKLKRTIEANTPKAVKDFRAEVAAMKEKRAALATQLTEQLDQFGGASATRENGNRILLTVNTREGGAKYRVTDFLADGTPSGHREYSDIEGERPIDSAVSEFIGMKLDPPKQREIPPETPVTAPAFALGEQQLAPTPDVPTPFVDEQFQLARPEGTATGEAIKQATQQTSLFGFDEAPIPATLPPGKRRGSPGQGELFAPPMEYDAGRGAPVNYGMSPDAVLKNLSEMADLADQIAAEAEAAGNTEKAERYRKSAAKHRAELFAGRGRVEAPTNELAALLDRFDEEMEFGISDLVDAVEDAGLAPEAVATYRAEEKEDFEEFAGRGDMDSARDNFVATLRGIANEQTKTEAVPATEAPAQQGQHQYAATPIPGTSAVVPQKVVVGLEEQRRLKVPNGRITDATGAAQAFQQLSRHAREKVAMIVLDAEGTPIAAFDLFSGSHRQSDVQFREVLTAAYMVPRAAGVWISHNHPSGSSVPSSSDLTLTRNLARAFSEGPIAFAGHVTIGQGEFTAIYPDGTSYAESQRIPPVEQDYRTVPVYERMIQHVAPTTHKIKGAAQSKALFAELNPREAGILLVNTEGGVIGWWRASEISAREVDFAELFRRIGMHNPAGLIAYWPSGNLNDMVREAHKLRAITRDLDVRVLDGIYRTAEGMQSLAQDGYDEGGDTYYFSVGQPRAVGEGTTPEAMRAELANSPTALHLGARLHILNSVHELPEAIYELAKNRGMLDTVEAAVSPSGLGDVYLIAPHIAPGDAPKILLHEAVGHWGLMQALKGEGLDVDAIFQDVYRSRSRDIAADPQVRAQQLDLRHPLAQNLAAAEWIARRAESGEEQSMWQRFVARIRHFFRTNGPQWVRTKEWTDNDILRLIRRGSEFLGTQRAIRESNLVLKNIGVSPTERIQPRIATETPAFKEWFGKSVVTNDDGSPRAVYHGTSDDFDMFDGREALAWFSEDPDHAQHYARQNDLAEVGPSLMPVYLRITHPLDLTGRGLDMDADTTLAELKAKIPELNLSYENDYYGYSVSGYSSARALPAWEYINRSEFFDELKDKGFDGLKVTESGTVTWSPVRQTQIKSATGNRGAFDPAARSIVANVADSDHGGALSPTEQVENGWRAYDPMKATPIRVADRLRRLLKRHARDKGTNHFGQAGAEDRLVIGVEDLAAALEENIQLRKERKITKPRARGYEYVMEKLFRASRTGDINYDGVQFAKWLLDRAPWLADDLGIALRGKMPDSGSAGRYFPETKVIRLLKDTGLFSQRTRNETVVHEILHHSERMMPIEVQLGIVREYAKQFRVAYNDGTTAEREVLLDMIRSQAGDMKAYERVGQAINQGKVDYKLYQFANESEFWAVNATRILSARYEASHSWVARARQWLKEFLEKAKGLLGLRSDSSVLRGLNNLMDTKDDYAPAFLSPRMLLELGGGSSKIPLNNLFSTSAQLYGMSADGRMRGIARKSTGSGAWTVYTTSGDPIDLLKHGSRTEAKALDAQAVTDIFTRAGMTVSFMAPPNLPPAEKAIIDSMGRSFDMGDKDIRGLTRGIVHPRTIASFHADFAPVVQAAEGQFEYRDQIVSDLYDELKPFSSLGGKSKRRVLAVAELGRLYKTTYGKGGAVVTVTNTNKDNAQLSKVGETITLTDREKAGYWALRRTMDSALGFVRDGRVRSMGLDPTRVRTPAQVLGQITAGMPKHRQKQLKQLADDVTNLMDMRRHGYIPFTRWGDYGIVVKRGDTVIRYEQIEGSLKEAQKRVDELRAKYPNAAVLGPMHLSKGRAYEPVNLGMLDQLARMAHVDQAGYEAIRDQLEAAQQRLGFSAHLVPAHDVAGYSGNFERAIADYVVGMASHLARQRYRQDWEQALGAIPGHKDQLLKYANAYREYANAPREELQVLRGTAYFFYLAGVPMTAAINMTQPWLTTMPLLSAFDLTTPWELTRAHGTAVSMINWSLDMVRPNQFFDPAKAPAGMRDALQAAWQRGFMAPMTTMEMMGMARNRPELLRGLDKATRVTVETVAHMFMTAERTNRLTTFIAAYRVASKPGMKDKILRTLSKNALAQVQLQNADDFAAAFAEWMVDETQFRTGKVNRATLQRGIGTAIFQFKDYAWQMIELYARTAALAGPQGKVAFALMLLLLGLVAGAWGLPFAESFRQLIEFALRRWTHQDVDLKVKLREAVIDITSSDSIARMLAVVGANPKMAAEMFSYGLPRYFDVSPELSGRIGLGQILPDPSRPETFAGVPADLLWSRWKKAGEWKSRDELPLAAAQVLPNFLKNVMEAAYWSEEGYRSQTSGRRLIGPDDLSTADIVMKGLGARSRAIAVATESEFEQNRMSHALDEMRRSFYYRKGTAMGKLETGRRQGDFDMMQRAREKIAEIDGEIKDWNDSHPALHEKIKLDDRSLGEFVASELIGTRMRDLRAPKLTRQRRRELEEQVER